MGYRAMNIMFRFIALALAILVGLAPAAAQQVPNHSVPIGQGVGNTGFRNAYTLFGS